MASIQRNTDALVAQMVSDSGEVRAAGEKVLAAARAEAARHTKTGSYASHFGMEHGRKDTVVYNDHPAAVPIEFGHVTKKGTFVPGLHIMLKARQAAG